MANGNDGGVVVVKVDLVIENAWVYRTFRQCFERMDIAVAGGKFFDVSPVSDFVGDSEQRVSARRGEWETESVFDGTGKFVIPGLVDIHMHVESSMTYPEEFSRAVVPFGVTTVVADPHESANVFGVEGILSFMEEETELDIFYGIPSSVPATRTEMETSGAEFGEKELRELLRDERVVCLGEVMNFKDLVAEGDTKSKRFLEVCGECGRKIRIEGHCPGLSGGDLAAFIRAGVDADHTEQTAESILEKTDMGMFLELQEKSLKEEVVEVVKRKQLYENIALVTDDTMPDRLMEGHLNRIVRLAVEKGMPAEKAIYLATFTPARRMHLDDRGIIAPGKKADFVVLPDLESFVPEAVFKDGKRCVDTSAEGVGKRLKRRFPDHFYSSVKCRLALASDFILPVADFWKEECREEALSGKPSGSEIQKLSGTAVVNVMQIQTFGTRAKHVQREISVQDGNLCWQEAGLCLAAVFERYGKNGNVSWGFVEHALEQKGAVATTWSHDSHNLLVLGNSVEDMVLAQNEVVHMQGGYVTASGGRVTAAAKLPVGGIISDKSLPELAAEIRAVRGEIERMGYVNNNVIMSISTLSLLVSPELKLSDQGLFDVKSQRKIPLVEAFQIQEEKVVEQ
ncbi:adenine deaminase C-terminal domain-containing protein [Hungatella sp.]|uniref:adenine deaminase C-terminal domain-containing protein n=1 Tax=Hungatella sp. TaxID=2613924 RepID=UPI002A835124|nr:adenine deaminase C-terminal domain-containing protein [Hungatella sp.]